MRKAITAILICLLVALFSYQPVLAEENKPVLDQANIEITINNNIYTVTEEITLSNLNGGSVEHTSKETTENKVTNVTFTSVDGELTPKVDVGETLHKYTIEPSSNVSSDEKVTYTIEYNVEKADNVFEIPLFVPEYPTSGDERVINLSFQAPDGTLIQKNSFPIVLESKQSYVEKHMANIPAIAKYVFSENPTAIHSFSIISFIALFSIFLLLVGWAIVEIRRGGNK